jgi:hypothetical protein
MQTVNFMVLIKLFLFLGYTMIIMKKYVVSFLGCLLAGPLFAQNIPAKTSSFEAVNTVLQEVQYKGKSAVRVTGAPGRGHYSEMALVNGINFTNGTIEADISGSRLPGTDTTFRGFVGIAFRVQKGDSSRFRFECFYLRPTNGRAEDQLRRNHSTQYVSEPEYPWQRLRKETPGQYESYVDLQAGEWTRIKIVVKDRYARLYINNATEPSLIVTDIKHGITTGSVALWIGAGTEAHFTNLKITRE